MGGRKLLLPARRRTPPFFCPDNRFIFVLARERESSFKANGEKRWRGETLLSFFFCSSADEKAFTNSPRRPPPVSQTKPPPTLRAAFRAGCSAARDTSTASSVRIVRLPWPGHVFTHTSNIEGAPASAASSPAGPPKTTSACWKGGGP